MKTKELKKFFEDNDFHVDLVKQDRIQCAEIETMKNLVKKQHGAGGFQFFTSENKGNTRLGKAKQTAIIKAVEDSWTEGVYQTTTGQIKRQLLNGNAEFLTLDRETGEYYFS